MTCRICNNNHSNTLYLVKEQMFETGEIFSYFICNNCGCLQIKDYPEDISQYYKENYYSFSNKNIITSQSRLKYLLQHERDIYLFNKKRLLGGLLNLIFPADIFTRIVSKSVFKKNATILDIGSGSGSRLIHLVNVGLNIKGIDPFISEDISYDNGLIIEKKNIEQINESYDLIMFNHVFEHLKNPFEILVYIKKFIKTNGVCLIRIPLVSSYVWEKYNINWIQIDAPRHFYLHSVKSMEILAEKAGYYIHDIIFDSTPFQFLGSEMYERSIPFIKGDFSLKNNSLFSKKEIKYYKELTENLNKQKRGDQAAFILKIKES